MSFSKVEFFQAFLSEKDRIEVRVESALSQFLQDFGSQIQNLDPQLSNDLASELLEDLQIDEEAISIFRSVEDFTDHSLGDGLSLLDEAPIVLSLTEKALAINNKSTLGRPLVMAFAFLIEQSLIAQRKSEIIVEFLRQNAVKLQEFRISKLERSMNTGLSTHTPSNEAALKIFTVNQQALAIHFLLTEGMEVRNVDNTKMTALAHLLAGKRIPVDALGRENIGNSGIKSAFGKMWQKSSKRHLADLLFVLKFFKALEASGSSPVTRTINAIEKEIEKTEIRIRRLEE